MTALRTGLLGKKIGMTQVFTAEGDLQPVTAILAAGNLVVAKRTVEKDGYAAVQLGFDPKPLRVTKRPALGHFKKAGVDPQRLLREVRVAAADLEKYEVGKPVPLDAVFQVGTYVDVIGTTKGKGYQGVMKLHHMAGFRNTHGTHEFFRHGGSIGCRLTPGRVHKGKRMSAHMGAERRTVQNLPVIDILPEGVILVAGSIPGCRNAYVMVRNATKRVGPVMKPDHESQLKAKDQKKNKK